MQFRIEGDMTMYQYAIIEMIGSIPHLVTTSERDCDSDARQDFEEYVRDIALDITSCYMERGDGTYGNVVAYAHFTRNVGTVKFAGKTVAKFYLDCIS
jgi:hypothetical protein